MRRRALLASIGTAAVAGCLGNAVGGGNTTTDRTTTQRTTDSYPRMTVSEISLDGLSDDIDASVDVTATQDATADQPLGLEIAVTNTADAERTWQFGAIVPWSTLYGEQVDGNRTVLLAPGGATHQVVPEPPQDDLCWRATDGIALIQVVKDVTFQPNETKSNQYAFLAGPESDCLSAGTYRFEDSNFLGKTTWGFDATLLRVVEQGGM